MDDQIDVWSADREHALALLARGGRRDEDRRMDAKRGTCQGDALAMIPGGCANDARLALLRRELGDQVMRAPNLVRAHRLQVLALEPHIRSRHRTQSMRDVQRRLEGDAIQALRRVVDIGGANRKARVLGGRRIGSGFHQARDPG